MNQNLTVHRQYRHPNHFQTHRSKHKVFILSFCIALNKNRIEIIIEHGIIKKN